jgi:toxin ParE1/3/4
MKLFWTEPAIRDLRDLRDYIAADSDFHAADFIASIIIRAERLTAFPMIGRVVPEAQTENVREILYRSYRIIYRIVGERVDVLTVVHGSRDLWGQEPKPWE